LKTVYINRKKFNQSIVYGLWSLLSVCLLVTVFISTSEVSSIYEVELGSHALWIDDEVCYTNYFEGLKCVSKLRWLSVYTPYDRQMFSLALSVFNFGFVGFWIYHKQQKLKFSFCEGSQSYPSVEDEKK
jgi:hypothetical protein